MRLSRFSVLLPILIGAVWIFHGAYSKLLDGVPRHRLIIGRVLGEDTAVYATPVIGVLEIAMGLWVISRRWPRLCALTQTLALIAMNMLEILYARDLLISPVGMVALNVLLLTGAWLTASQRNPSSAGLPPGKSLRRS